MTRGRRFTQAPASVVPPSRSGQSPARRVNITLPELQHEALQQQGANVSGVIRSLLDDYLSASTITLRVDPPTKDLYDRVMESTGASEQDVAEGLVRTLEGLLQRKLEQLEELKAAVLRKRT
ncbi:MAG: hypothetical protein KF718_24590 [Polyangiaceae bacterium]|nr:hypothetical protein [Polyangiaceae bacterium]